MPVLERLDDAVAVAGDEQLSPIGPRTAKQDSPRHIQAASEKQKPEPSLELLDLYFAEVGQTPLLSDEQIEILSRQIEDGKHLSQIENELFTQRGAQPSPIDLFLALAERLTRKRWLFPALCQHLHLPSQDNILGNIMHPTLRHAIDGPIASDLSAAIANITGTSQTRVHRDLIELSLDSRLLPWHLVDKIGLRPSLTDFRKVSRSPEFRAKLEAQRSEIARHFDEVKERAKQATQDMIQANLRLVISVAKGRVNPGMPLADLIQEGNIGLMQAVKKFDHRKGYRFSTYAVPWIWQAIDRAIDDQSRIVRLPGHVVDDVARLLRARDTLAQRFGRQPTERELASETGLSLRKTQSLLKIIAERTSSLDTPVGDEGSRVGDLIADQAARRPEDEASATLLKDRLTTALRSLTPRERRIIELRFGLDDQHGRTLLEVGKELGLTKERIRQIEKEALAKLRHPSRSRKLIGYLD